MRSTDIAPGLLVILVAAMLVSAGPGLVEACTRALYVAKDDAVIVGQFVDARLFTFQDLTDVAPAK